MNLCEEMLNDYGEKIKEVVQIQHEERREAVFFAYEDGSTSEIVKGEATHIDMSPEQQDRLINQGNIISSVHSHPDILDPSTVDMMTAVTTQQDTIGVAVPTFDDGTDDDFILTCINLSSLNQLQKNSLFRSMRRSSFGFIEGGRQLRKHVHLGRFSLGKCRTREA